MAPTLTIGDRVLFDTAGYRFGRPFDRGDIILFYPPLVKLSRGDLDYSLVGMLERAARPLKLAHSKSSVKRVIGLAGDRIEVLRGKGVKVNGTLIDEPYVEQPADYELRQLKDIGGMLLSEPRAVQPYADREEAIVVPADSVFVLGDNRNHSEDSHIYGFLKVERVLGRAVVVYYPHWKKINNR